MHALARAAATFWNHEAKTDRITKTSGQMGLEPQKPTSATSKSGRRSELGRLHAASSMVWLSVPYRQNQPSLTEGQAEELGFLS
jgi:hypothetical protein